MTCFSDASREADPYIAPGYTHDAQCVVYRGPDADYQGRQLCFGSNEDVVTVFDVTDKADVRIVSQGEYPNDVYTHQGWLTEDQRYFLVNDEIDERTDFQSGGSGVQRTIVMDMSDLDSPDVALIYDSGRSRSTTTSTSGAGTPSRPTTSPGSASSTWARSRTDR